jgi:hypothetical protein
MNAYLCRWPNGVVSIVAAENEEEVVKQLTADGISSMEDAFRADAKPGIIIPLPKEMRVHLHFTEDFGFEFHGWPAEATPTLRTLFPHLMAATEVPHKTKKAAVAAAKKVWALETGKDK